MTSGAHDAKAAAPDAPIALVPYDAGWPAKFDAERALLEAVLAPWLAGRIEQRLAFRDALRHSPALVTEYAALKRQLAERFRFDREACTAD